VVLPVPGERRIAIATQNDPGVNRFGPYRLTRLLGRGGMAEVWSGVHDNGRPVALKRILPHLCDQLPIVEMFLSEARLAALIDHPNIVRTFDVGILERQPFIAMELVDGVDLRRIWTAAATRLPIGFCLYVATRLCAALKHVHSLKGPRGAALGLIHRDISHSNVMLTRGGEIKLLDFGVAKAAQSSSLVQTQVGELKGKLGYMAPEILREAPYDQRADLFSVGVVLYELLVHDRLFQASTQAGMLAQNLGCVVAPPSQRGCSLSPALERIVMRALAAEPAARQASAAEMLAELSALPEARHFGARDAARLLEERVLRAPLEVTTSAPTLPLNARIRAAAPSTSRPRLVRFALTTIAIALGAGLGTYALVARRHVPQQIPATPSLPVAQPQPAGDVMSSAELTLPLPGERAAVTPAPALAPAPTTMPPPPTVPSVVTRPQPKPIAKRHAVKRKPSADTLINGRELMNPLRQ
jgi:serine/threonine-protein kinase